MLFNFLFCFMCLDCVFTYLSLFSKTAYLCILSPVLYVSLLFAISPGCGVEASLILLF